MLFHTRNLKNLPFSHVTDEELKANYYILILSNVPNHSFCELYEKCIYFENETSENTVNEAKDFQFDIDPDRNLFDKVNRSCNYYTVEKLNGSIKHVCGLSIIHFNARSLKKNFDDIVQCVTNMQIKFDVIAISENWLESNLNLNLTLLLCRRNIFPEGELSALTNHI